MSEAIYKRLSKIMDSKGMTVADVARKCKLADSTVRGIIARKQKSVALEVAFKLAAGLGVSLEYLNGDDETSAPGYVKTMRGQILPAKKPVSPEEMEMIKKYRVLDEHGKKIVSFVLEEEVNRCEKDTPESC